MKTHDHYLKTTRGSAFITVIIVMTMMAILTASIISYSVTEQRFNERNRLVLSTRNAAETVANYAAAQLSSKLNRLRSTSSVRYTGIPSHSLVLPDTGTLLSTEYQLNAIEMHAGLTSATPLTYIDPVPEANKSDTYAGLSVIKCSVPVVAKTTLTHPILGSYSAYTEQDLSVAIVPLFQYAIFYNYLPLEFGPGADMIISGAVHCNHHIAARCQDGRSNTVQFKDRVTCVGDFYANGTKFGAIYNADGSYNASPGGTGPLKFQDPTGTVTNIYNGSRWRDHSWSTNATGTPTASTIKLFADFATNTYGGNLRTNAHEVTPVQLPGTAPDPENKTRKNIARSVIEPASKADTEGLKQTKFSRRAGLYIIVNPSNNPDDTVKNQRDGIMPDGSKIKMDAFSYRCWLNTVDVDGNSVTEEVVLPGQPSYWDSASSTMIKNDLPNRFTNVTAIGMNQVLRIPLPTSAAATAIYNAAANYTGYTTPTPASKAGFNTKLNNGTTRYALPSPTTTGYDNTYPPSLTNFSNGYFYDLRRSDGNNGYGTLATKRTVDNFKPRPIAKIDFDVTRFKLAVERTMLNSTRSTDIFNPDVPTPGNWANNVLNPSAITAQYDLGPQTVTAGGAYTYTVFPNDAVVLKSDPFMIYNAKTGLPVTSGNLYNSTADATPWWDGVAVYIHSVDAEDKEIDKTTKIRKRTDSGVRLVNGRGVGPTFNLLDGSRTGFSIATNDAAYIIGHFNADGKINSSASDTSSVGGYSARYPDSTNEKLCSVMADSLTILSQPVYKKNGSGTSAYFTQTDGWSDTLSANRMQSSGWSSSWQTTDPSTGNQTDGTNQTQYAGRMPNEGSHTVTENVASGDGIKYLDTTLVLQSYTYTSPTGSNIKLEGTNTEISSCLLQGIVRTTSATNPRGKEYDGTALTYQTLGYQSSGGMHNFPRLSEYWSGDLYIRGSMVAMFESEVACEPWLATRIYSAPGRMWGLHNNLRSENPDGHHVPLEPMLINVSRWHFTALDEATYNIKKNIITALPAP